MGCISSDTFGIDRPAIEPYNKSHRLDGLILEAKVMSVSLQQVEVRFDVISGAESVPTHMAFNQYYLIVEDGQAGLAVKWATRSGPVLYWRFNETEWDSRRPHSEIQVLSVFALQSLASKVRSYIEDYFTRFHLLFCQTADQLAIEVEPDKGLALEFTFNGLGQVKQVRMLSNNLADFRTFERKAPLALPFRYDDLLIAELVRIWIAEPIID